MARKSFVRVLRPYVELHRDPRTGLAWIEDGRTGNGHSAHPNIAASGSIRGMKSRGHWGKSDRCIRSHGFIYNIDRVAVTRGTFDRIACEECRCVGCKDRRVHVAERLEYLRGELRAERISYDELHELQSLAAHIRDTELLEAAGVPERLPAAK